MARHIGEPTLVIGQYLDQLAVIAERLDAPLITGKTPNAERERLYDAFRAGTQRLLVASKVANFSVDLPDAAVAIQVSGTFGSRQEEAQRLGRILRPKPGDVHASFYAVVSRGNRRPGVRRAPPAVPRRAGLPVHDHRRRGRTAELTAARVRTASVATDRPNAPS